MHTSRTVAAAPLWHAARQNWRWYLAGWIFLPLVVLGQEAASAGFWVPSASWVLPLFTFMPLIADVPRWRGRARLRDTVVWGMLVPFGTGLLVSLCRVTLRSVVGWPR